MKRPPEPLTPEEVALLVGATGRSPSGIRNRALILTLARTGLRIGEALALMPKDVENGSLRVQHGKGDRSRVVAIPADLEDPLGRWLEVRARLGANGRHPVFCLITTGKVGEPVQDAYVRSMLPRLAKKAGIEKRVHAHGLRHSHALELVRAGLDIIDVRDQLGHASVAVTDRYLRSVAPEARLDRVRRALEGGAADQE